MLKNQKNIICSILLKMLSLINAKIVLILEIFFRKNFEIEFKIFHFYFSLTLIQKILFHFWINIFVVNLIYFFYGFNLTFFSFCDDIEKKELEQIFSNGKKIFTQTDNTMEKYDKWYDYKGCLKRPIISRLVSIKEPLAHETLFYFSRGQDRHVIENVHNSVYYDDGSIYSTKSNTNNFIPYFEFTEMDYDCQDKIVEHIEQKPGAFHSFKIIRNEEGVSSLQIKPPFRYSDSTTKIYKTVEGGVKKWRTKPLSIINVLEKK